LFVNWQAVGYDLHMFNAIIYAKQGKSYLIQQKMISLSFSIASNS